MSSQVALTDEQIIEKYKRLDIARPAPNREPFEMGNLHILLRDEGREDRKVRNGATFATTWLDTRNPDWMARDDPKRPQNLHILQKGTHGARRFLRADGLDARVPPRGAGAARGFRAAREASARVEGRAHFASP